MLKLCYGVGINDADYVTQRMCNGAKIVCPYYRSWSNMLKRAYYYYGKENKDSRTRTYADVEVCNDWHRFSTYKGWVLSQQGFIGLELDKDIISKGNRVYGPDVCCFVPKFINYLLLGCQSNKGEYLLGVTKCKSRSKPFSARVRSTGLGKIGTRTLGYYCTEQEAHMAWQRGKAAVIFESVMAWSKMPHFNSRAGDALVARADNLIAQANNREVTLSL